MIELLFNFVLGVADFALVKFGGVLVRAASGGRWQAEPLRSRAYSYKSRAGALSYSNAGVRVVTHTGQLVAALLFWVVFGVTGARGSAQTLGRKQAEAAHV